MKMLTNLNSTHCRCKYIKNYIERNPSNIEDEPFRETGKKIDFRYLVGFWICLQTYRSYTEHHM